ncbi:tudor domain-containing protein 1 isoform X2 [Pseudoliparis swirei]|uniref:tudor domain-containing protein 1 isoform X2 n=1 Tax=Pseudoliparis swirei TaxID=2059687 RepID=UPI0024BDC1A5|nr:tudor domain-containing protein 1 isoform X2 [Pseudoliparis swirei]
MHHSFSPTMVRPNLPLRKPSSSPMSLSTPRPPAPPNPLPVPEAIVRTQSDAIGDDLKNVSVCRDQSAVSSTPAALICNYCGNQGNLCCKRCKRTLYCSVPCQTEDWKAHRHICKPIDPVPENEKPKDTTASPVTGDKAGLLESQQGDGFSLQRVYLKDLYTTKINKGTDIQASVVEFYSPGRFFLVAQCPELLKALQNISTELQKLYSCPSVTTYVPCVGEVCAVQFSCDLNWYRGLVQTLSADQKMANILYIDFGNEETVPVDRIKPLSTKIQPCCPCAMECRITGVVPTAGSWSGESSIFVKKLLAGKTLTVRLVETQENDRIHSVDILFPTGNKLSAFLVEHGYAEEEAVNIAPTQQEINAMVTASLENFRRRSDGKDDNTWAQPPEPLTQALGDSFSVMITDLQSPSEIILQKVENAGMIQELQLNLREHCCQLPAPQNFRPAPGTVCCARFSEDKQWYRAKVLGYSSEERVCVGYIDFGNSEEVDLANLQPISTALLALPMQAIPCVLAGVQPVGESWSEDCLLALRQRISNRILRIEITATHDGKAFVTMVDEASDPQADVAELLRFAGFAASAPIPVGSDLQADQTATATVEPQVPTPAACEPLVWSCAELPCDGQTVALLASVVKNPREFYCCLNNPTDHQRLMELGTELKRHCEANVSASVPKVGEPCCALFPGDGEWYRAMVNGLSEEDVSVYIVDYGHSMKVEKSNLRSITNRLLTLPFQAIRCWLKGVELLGSEWSSEALLLFQTLVASEQLSARVLSVTDQGYGLDLESKGQNVATALISLATKTHATTGSGHARQEKIQANEQSPKRAHCSNQVTGVSSKEMPTEGGTAMPSEALCFPVDWKTVELPLNNTFQPCFAAITSPSLFYLISPSQGQNTRLPSVKSKCSNDKCVLLLSVVIAVCCAVDPQKLQGVMMELAASCNTIQASSSSTVLSRPAPGAACCAQFSADSNWYRAVVLEVAESELSVVYADYGNTEKVPFSRVLPIPMNLLQLPFQVTRCTLTELFPAELPEEVQKLFQNLLSSGVLATVQSFNGSENVLSLTLPTEKGGGHIGAMISDALQAKSHPGASITRKVDHAAGIAAAAITAAGADCRIAKPESPKEPGNTAASAGLAMNPEPAPETPQQKKNTSAGTINEDPVQKILEQMEPPCKITSSNDPPTSGCCCLKLITKIDHLQQQLSLITLLLGHNK